MKPHSFINQTVVGKQEEGAELKLGGLANRRSTSDLHMGVRSVQLVGVRDVSWLCLIVG